MFFYYSRPLNVGLWSAHVATWNQHTRGHCNGHYT